MSTSRILQHLRRLFHRDGGSGVTDGQLLERFVTERDETAFEVLVWRHGPMVLALGQRVLGNVHDAEDVLQATFLTLVRKAGSIGKSESLSSWLYKVAYRIAVRLRIKAAKTRADNRLVEAATAPPETEDSVWRELRPLLDAAIERLPEKYRTVIVLCDLQGKSHREAAEQLGCAVGTVSTRVLRARQLLRKRLARHGLSVSVGVLSAALAQPTAAALPATLTAATVRAAVQLTGGIVPPHLAELIEGANPMMLMSRFKIVMLLALAAGAAAVGAGVVAHREPPVAPQEPSRGEAPKAEAKKQTETVPVRGRVLDPDGKPLQGVRLYWPRLPKDGVRNQEDIENMENAERAKTAADGRFRFELPRSDIQPDGPSGSLLAAADGYGVDLVELPKEASSHDVTLRLVKDQPIKGRIISTEGKPMAGINVRIMGVGKTRQKRLDDFLDAWKRQGEQAIGQVTAYTLFPRNEKFSQAVTDKDGRFRVQGIGVEHIAMVRLRAPGFAPTPLFVVHRPNFDPAAWNKAARDRLSAEQRRQNSPMLLYGPKIEYVAPAGRRIEGTVREAGSGKPVPGYHITINVPNGLAIIAVSDNEGKYKLLGVPKMKEYYLYAQPPANSAWLLTQARGEDAEGLRTIQIDFTAARGIIVRGRVLDRATGKGVYARVHFAPLPSNKFFGKPGYDLFEQVGNMTDIQDAGRYQVAVMPGPVVLMAQMRGFTETANGRQELNPYKTAEFDAKDRERIEFLKNNGGDRFFRIADEHQTGSLDLQNAVKLLDLAPDAGPTTCDLYLERGKTRTIRIEDMKGKPLKGTTVAGVTAFPPYTFPIKDATCTVFALDPKKPRRLLFFHAPRNLAGTMVLRGDEKEPVVVRLGPAGSVIGRVLKNDGKPLAGTEVRVIFPDHTDYNNLYGVAQHDATVRTDKEGRFRLEGIVPEVKAQVRINIEPGVPVFFDTKPPISDKQLKPGQTLDLGDIRLPHLP